MAKQKAKQLSDHLSSPHTNDLIFPPVSSVYIRKGGKKGGREEGGKGEQERRKILPTQR
jgi:hypothetical protein